MKRRLNEMKVNLKVSSGVIAAFALLLYAYYVGQLLWGIIAVAFLFWLWMLIDCLQRPIERFPNGGEYDQLIWCLAIFFVHFVGAVMYYFLVKRRRNTGLNHPAERTV